KPEQLVDDRLEVQLLGGREREALLEVEAHLVPEHRQRAGAGAVVLLRSVGENPFEQVVVLTHGCVSHAADRRLDGGAESIAPPPLPKPSKRRGNPSSPRRGLRGRATIARKRGSGAYSTKTSSRRRRILGSAATTSRKIAVHSRTDEIGRVKNTVASPRPISMPRPSCSSLTRPS